MSEKPKLPTDSPTWPYVLAFALKMEAKLEMNRHKGDRDGWLGDTPDSLSRRIAEEHVELQEAMEAGCDPDDVWDEAADVANMAMMTADSYWARKAPVSSARR